MREKIVMPTSIMFYSYILLRQLAYYDEGAITLIGLLRYYQNRNLEVSSAASQAAVLFCYIRSSVPPQLLTAAANQFHGQD